MNNADDLKFEKRASGQKILVLPKKFSPIDLKSINKDDRVKLKCESVHVVVEVDSCNDGNVCTGKIYAFESSKDRINFQSIGVESHGMTIGQKIIFRPEHIFFISRN